MWKIITFLTVTTSVLATKASQESLISDTLQLSRNDTYNPIWGGLAVNYPSSQETRFTSLLTSFIVPRVQPPKWSQPGQYHAGIWVGMDGCDGASSLLQAGVTAEVTILNDGAWTTAYEAWFEWFPEVAHTIDPAEFPVSAGDEIEIGVSRVVTSGGTITISNSRTKKVITRYLDAPTGTEIVGTSVEFIVEAFIQNGEQVSMADFGSVDFEILDISTTAKNSKVVSLETLMAENAQVHTLYQPLSPFYDSHFRLLSETKVSKGGKKVQVSFDDKSWAIKS